MPKAAIANDQPLQFVAKGLAKFTVKRCLPRWRSVLPSQSRCISQFLEISNLRDSTGPGTLPRNSMMRPQKTGTAIPQKSGHVGLSCRALALAITMFGFAPTAWADDWTIGSAQAAPLPQAEANFSFSIARQPLAAALREFSTQTESQLVYDPVVAAGRKSSPITGKLGSFDALRQLLAGTGLAPARLLPNGFTIFREQDGPVFASLSPIHAPMLTLSQLHVDAPQPENLHLYAMTVQYAIQSALQQDQFVRRNKYRAAIGVWLNQGGKIQQSSLLVSTGDVGLDAAITEVVRKVSIGQPPPYGLPQPVFVQILTQVAGR
jgi:hypothetical protein